MKKIIFLIGLLIFGYAMNKDIFAQDSSETLIMPEPATAIDAKETNFEKTPFNKIGRGITNASFFWLEVPITIKETAKERNDEFTGLSLGLVKGIFVGLLRAATGLFDVVTFIIPPYDRPLMEPEYVFSRFDS